MIIKQSPLEGRIAGSTETLVIRELPGIQTLDLRVAPGTPSHTAIVDAIGMTITSKPGQIEFASIGNGEVYTLCLAPDWWLIVGSQETGQKLTSLKSNEAFHFSVVDVSGQRTTVELEGPKVRQVLAHLWEQDLREKNFPVGSVSQGLMAKAPVIVCHIAPMRYRILVRSSFALHFWKTLIDAAEAYF